MSTVSTPTIAQIKKELAKKKSDSLLPFKLSVLRNVMIEPIEYYYKHEALGLSLKAVVKFGDYDQIYQESQGSKHCLLEDDTDCVVVFLKLETASPLLTERLGALKKEKIEHEISRLKNYISQVISGIRSQTSAIVLWQGFEMPVFSTMGIIEDQFGKGLANIVSELNKYVQRELNSFTSAYFVDMNKFIARVGARNFYDHRYWHIGKAPYSRSAYQEFAKEHFKYIKVLKGKSKKCIVLDCDNTLWGGVVGEDGIEGIKISKDYPGSIYHQFQIEILNLYDRGIIIALCSKNNEEDVLEILRNHPNMILKEEHISAHKINWNDKASNIAELAIELNIGLDSFVFVDDSEFEVNLVRKRLPQVHVIHFDAETKLKSKELINDAGLFDTLSLSSEDRNRSVMYKSEIERKRHKVEFEDLDSYLKSLEMNLTIDKANYLHVARVSQLTLKTNQFNLTTKRYSESEIISFLENGGDIFYLNLQDKFGDYGITGVCIVKVQGRSADIDTFLLSCRILGRYVEKVFLFSILNYLSEQKIKIVTAKYCPSPKNSQVSDFYDEMFFKRVQEDKNCILYIYEKEARKPVCYDIFNNVEFMTGSKF